MEYQLSQRGMGCEGTGYVANDVVREGWRGSSWGKEGSLMIPGVPPGYQWSVATEVVDVFSDVVNVVLNIVFED